MRAGKFGPGMILVLLLLAAGCGEALITPQPTPPPTPSLPPPDTALPYPGPTDSYPWPTQPPPPPPSPTPSPTPPLIVLGAEVAPPAERETYVSTTVVVAPVGSGPGEIGFFRPQVPESMPSMADVFTVDGRGNIYILDYLNQRVVQFDPTGRFAAEIRYGDAVIFALDLAVDAAGQVYVYDGAGAGRIRKGAFPKVQVFDRQGDLLREYIIPPWLSGWEIRAMRVDEAGTLWVEGEGSYPGAPIIEGQPYRPVTVPLGNADEVFSEEYQRAAAVPGLMRNTGTYFSYIPVFSESSPLFLYDQKGKRIYECPGCVGRFQMDLRGNMYLVAGEEQGYALKKFNPRGALIASFSLPICNHSLVNENGILYCLSFDWQTRSAYQVIRWQRE